MEQTAIQDVIDQYRHTFRILYEEIARFDPQQWMTGISLVQTPVRQAMHTIDCLDFYFTPPSGECYVWGHRFGGKWWDLPDSALPDQETVLAYAREIEQRTLGILGALQDQDCSTMYLHRTGQHTRIGYYIYALKHTLHHHGQLAALAVYHTGDGGSWD